LQQLSKLTLYSGLRKKLKIARQGRPGERCRGMGKKRAELPRSENDAIALKKKRRGKLGLKVWRMELENQ